MDLVTLNANNQPEKLVQNYDSLIWTERFNTVGDFQIKAGDIATFLALLPEGKVVSLRESNIAMVVETHRIERKKNIPESITIVGRAVESILDRRVVLPAVAANASDWFINAKIPSDVAWHIVNQIVGLGLLDANDIIPASWLQLPTPSDYITGPTPNTGPTRTFSVPTGNLLSTVLNLIQATAKADTGTVPPTPELKAKGIRAVRPTSAGTAISLQFYSGTDKSNIVYFDATRDLLDDGSYLFSKQGSASTAYIIGPANAAKLNKTLVAASGLNRRVILVDGTGSGENSATVLAQQGELSLSEAKEIAIFDGSINADLSPYRYGVDYFLGDTVKLVGDYGLTQLATVTEYIRSEDATGTKGYPTLATVV